MDLITLTYILYGTLGIGLVILLIYLAKSQSKHVSSLKPGDVIEYKGFPSKIVEIKGK